MRPFDDDDEIFESDKFDDCAACKHRFCEWICKRCDMGEEFEEEDLEELDELFV